MEVYIYIKTYNQILKYLAKNQNHPHVLQQYKGQKNYNMFLLLSNKKELGVAG